MKLHRLHYLTRQYRVLSEVSGIDTFFLLRGGPFVIEETISGNSFIDVTALDGIQNFVFVGNDVGLLVLFASLRRFLGSCW